MAAAILGAATQAANQGAINQAVATQASDAHDEADSSTDAEFSGPDSEAQPTAGSSNSRLPVASFAAAAPAAGPLDLFLTTNSTAQAVQTTLATLQDHMTALRTVLDALRDTRITALVDTVSTGLEKARKAYTDALRTMQARITALENALQSEILVRWPRFSSFLVGLTNRTCSATLHAKIGGRRVRPCQDRFRATWSKRGGIC